LVTTSRAASLRWLRSVTPKASETTTLFAERTT
jgi:hypothetical protein